MNVNIIRSGMQRLANRPILRAASAVALLLFATVIAPLCALMIACAMPCCEGKSVPFVQSAAAAACAKHCAIRNTKASHELPDAVAPSTETSQVAFALAGAENSADLAPATPPRLPAFSVESHHAVPGDAPVYLYNSVFLI